MTSLLDHLHTALADLSEVQVLERAEEPQQLLAARHRTRVTDPEQWRAAVDAACEWAVDPAAVAL